MAEIELYEHEKKYKSSLKTLEESSTSERNKILIKEFLNDCTIGWGGKKLGKARLIRCAQVLRILAELSHKDFDYIDKHDIKDLLSSFFSKSLPR